MGSVTVLLEVIGVIWQGQASLNGAALTAACEAVTFSSPVATITQLRLQ